MLRRVVLHVLALLVATTSALVVAPAQADDPPAYTTISGRVIAPGGGPLTGPVLVTLFSWFPPGDAALPTGQDGPVFLPAGSDGTFTLSVPGPGYWAVRARPANPNPSSYLTTWYGSGESIASARDQDGVVSVPENDPTPLTGRDITLRRGVTVAGTVRGTNGQPLADATVDLSRWNAAGAREPIPGVPGAITDTTTGRWSANVPEGTPLSLTVADRVGYAPWILGGQGTTRTDDNTVVATDGTTQDVTLTPDWSDTGSNGRVQRRETCLRHALSGTADLGSGPRLDVSSKGVIAPEDSDWPGSDPGAPGSPLQTGASVAALVPYWSDTARQVTWGVDGSTLCAIWRSDVDQMAFQALVSADGTVRFNYGSVGANLYQATPQAGWTEGTGAGRQRLLLRGPYADGLPTALTAGSLGSDLAGRYDFTYGGFVVVPRTRPVVGGTLAPGRTVRADDVRWSDRGSTSRYQWYRDGLRIGGATGRSYVVRPADAGRRLSVRAFADRPGQPVARTTSRGYGVSKGLTRH